MEESVTYQAIIAKGRIKGIAEGIAEGKVEGKVEEARKMLLLIGDAHLGSPSKSVLNAIQAIAEVEQIEDLARRVNAVPSWEALLRPSDSRRRNGTRKKTKKK